MERLNLLEGRVRNHARAARRQKETETETEGEQPRSGYLSIPKLPRAERLASADGCARGHDVDTQGHPLCLPNKRRSWSEVKASVSSSRGRQSVRRLAHAVFRFPSQTVLLAACRTAASESLVHSCHASSCLRLSDAGVTSKLWHPSTDLSFCTSNFMLVWLPLWSCKGAACACSDVARPSQSRSLMLSQLGTKYILPASRVSLPVTGKPHYHTGSARPVKHCKVLSPLPLRCGKQECNHMQCCRRNAPALRASAC